MRLKTTKSINPNRTKLYWVRLAGYQISHTGLIRGMAMLMRERKKRKLWTNHMQAHHDEEANPFKDRTIHASSFHRPKIFFHADFKSRWTSRWSAHVHNRKNRKRYNEYQYDQLERAFDKYYR